MRSKIKGWRTPEREYARRRPILIWFIIVTAIGGAIVFPILTWGIAPLPFILLLITTGPITGLMAMGMVWVMAQSYFKNPKLTTDRPVDEVRTLVEAVLDSHGLEWKTYSYADYIRKGRNEDVRSMFRDAPSKGEGYLIDVPEYVLHMMGRDGRTHMGMYPKPLPDQLMTDIENAVV